MNPLGLNSDVIRQVNNLLSGVDAEEFVDNIGKITRLYYESLVKQGFTNDTALQLTIAAVGRK